MLGYATVLESRDGSRLWLVRLHFGYELLQIGFVIQHDLFARPESCFNGERERELRLANTVFGFKSKFHHCPNSLPGVPRYGQPAHRNASPR